MAESTDPVQGPMDREKALSAAYLRLTGCTQAEAASAAGVGERTLRTWETCSWWGEIKAEASGRWLDGLRTKTRKAIERLIDGLEPATVRFAAERIMDEFQPPKQRAELSGPNGGPIQTEDVGQLSDSELQERANRLHNRVAHAFRPEATNGHHPNGNGNGAHG
jgi:hypothetical protein